MVDQWLLSLILFFFLLCLSIAYCYCKTVLISDTLRSTFDKFFRFHFPKKTLGYLISHYALLSTMSPKMEKELGNNSAQRMLMYAQWSCVSKTLNTFFELYFSHTGRVWSIFNLIPFLWLRLSLLYMEQEAHDREDVLFLLKSSAICAAGSCFIGLIFAAFRCCHNSTNKLNITPSLSLPAIRPL